MTKPFSGAEIEEALRKSLGNISNAAKLLGVTRATVHNRINKSPKLQECVAEFREQAVDNAESALQRAVLQGEAWATCFTLKTLGKSRGYIERQETEISGPGGGELKITIVDPRKKE